MRPKWFSNYKQSGSAGISALLFMLLLGAIGGAFIAITSTELNTAASYRDGIAAQYLAEAGVQHALVKLRTDDSFVQKTNKLTTDNDNTLNSSTKNSDSVTEGSYKVTVTGSGSTRTITSTGIIQKKPFDVKRQLVISITLPGNTSLIPTDLGKYTTFSDSSIQVNGHGEILGPAGSRGKIDTNGKGSADEVYQWVSDTLVPTFSGIDYTKSPQLNLSISTVSGIYYVDGALNLNSHLTTPTGKQTVIYVKGDVSIEGNGSLTGSFLIISGGSVHINSNDPITGIFISTSNSESHVNNKGTLSGSIFSHGPIKVGGTIQYNSSLINEFSNQGANGFSIISWNNK